MNEIIVHLADRRNLIYIIKNENKNKEKVNYVIDFVKGSGGIEYAEKKMFEYQKEAFDLLNTFPESESKNSLKQLVLFTTERKK